MTNVNVQKALNVAILHIEANYSLTNDSEYLEDLNLCKAALAEIERCEPVYLVNELDLGWEEVNRIYYDAVIDCPKRILYTSPISKEWVGLSADDISDIHLSIGEEIPLGAISATEAKLKQINTKG